MAQSFIAGHRRLVTAVGFFALASPLAVGIRGQSTPGIESRLGNPPSFDVASVKPNKSDAPPHSNFPLNSGSMYTPNGGLFSATNWPLITYIAFAYNLLGNQIQFLVPQLPHWVMTDRFDIQARAVGNPTKDQMRLMVQSLLADRFKLAVHTEKRELPVLAFVLSKPGRTGAQLQAHPAGAPCDTDIAPAAAPKLINGLPAICGTILGLPPAVAGRSRLAGRNVTIGFMADMFSQRVNLGRPMVDATGLKGTFDFVLEYVPESKTPPPDAGAAPAPDGPTFEEALQDQLGIKMVSQKSPIDVIVVDHIEMPSAN